MGTDTMAYAASTLSFLLENLSKPVIITGSMLPLHDLLQDASRNLLVSIVLAASLDLPEVAVFMDNALLRGNRTVKVDAGGLAAFASPNYPSLARLETGLRVSPANMLPPPSGRFHVARALETGILVLRLTPGFSDEPLGVLVKHTTTLRALVLQLYGTGNAPSRRSGLLDTLRAAVDRGIIVVAVTQCVKGGVDLGAYALGAPRSSIGVVSAGDSTTEAVTAKLAYLLAWPGMHAAEVAKLMGKSLRGEVTEVMGEGRVGTPTVVRRGIRTEAASGGDVLLHVGHMHASHARPPPLGDTPRVAPASVEGGAAVVSATAAATAAAATAAAAAASVAPGEGRDPVPAEGEPEAGTGGSDPIPFSPERAKEVLAKLQVAVGRH